MSRYKTYRVWFDEGEEWDDDPTNPPHAIINAYSPSDAAIEVSIDHGCDAEERFIVECEGVYCQIDVVTAPQVMLIKQVTLAQLRGDAP